MKNWKSIEERLYFALKTWYRLGEDGQRPKVKFDLISDHQSEAILRLYSEDYFDGNFPIKGTFRESFEHMTQFAHELFEEQHLGQSYINMRWQVYDGEKPSSTVDYFNEIPL